MKKTVLVLGLAWASMMTMAQSADQKKSENGQASGTSNRDVATGQASGKRMHKPMMMSTDQVNAQGVTTARETGTGMATGKTAQAPMGTHHDGVIHRDLAAREASSGQASGQTEVRESPSKASVGKTTAVDDWNAQNKNSMSGAQSNPMYKDDGKSGTNPMYESNSKVTKTRSNVQNNRVAAGDVNGDGAADAVVKSKSNITNNRMAAGDVNGDGKADVSVQPTSPAQMKGDFSRGHQPDRKASSDAGAGKGANDKKTAPRDYATGQASGKRQ